MIDEDRLKEHLKDKCYELLVARELVKSKKDEMLRKAFQIMDGDNFWLGSIYKDAVEVKSERNMLNMLELNLSQLAHILGGEYLEIYQRLCKDE